MLGWETIEAKIVQVGDDPLKRLDWEYHENVGRKDLTSEEQQAYVTKRQQMLSPNPKSFWIKVKEFLSRLFFFFKRKK